MNLREALGVLSKSSPFAVTTSGEIVDPELRAIKEYLYVETEIESEFKAQLESIQPDGIIFLCGSSGDGKSEILTRYESLYEGKVSFHLDATHSFDPGHTAVDTLNTVFSDQKASNHPLVVGINVGMLANYEREGSDGHKAVRDAIKAFLQGDPQESLKYSFIDFESLPKFSINKDEISSSFFSALLEKVAIDDQKNKFRDYFDKELNEGPNRDIHLVSNYLLLRDRGVQKVILGLLLNARIRKDQFVTARMLLDFIFCILTGPKYLFDNLFEGGENELLQAIANFDPSIKRNKELDLFILNRTLGISDTEYKKFRDEARDNYKIDSRGKVKAESFVRQLFLLRESTLENNYPNNFIHSFSDSAESLYREVWELHKNYDGDPSDKQRLRQFYDAVVFSAITSYANRNAPYLSKDEFYLSSHGEYDIASEIEMNVSYKSIEKESRPEIHFFTLYLEANGSELEPLPVNVNLLSLMLDVVGGYRPNKYDKNSVVLLDELVTHITGKVSKSDLLYLFKNGNSLAKVRNNNNDDDLRVSRL